VKWEHHSFASGRSVSTIDVLQIFNQVDGCHLAVSFTGAELVSVTDQEDAGLMRAVTAYKNLAAIFIKGSYGGIVLGLAACADLSVATPGSNLSFAGIGEETAGYISARLAHQIGKSKAMQLLLEGGMEVRQLYRMGLVGRLISEEEMADPLQFLNELLPGAALGAALRLKKVWRAQEGASVDNALAAERLEFQRCFKDGAAGGIADYLVKRMKK
jgi:2-(1,2-epoxy-1,2-dihydrophenyl)acetyl-CoA isomerase